MKRMIAIVLSVIMLLTAAACGSSNVDTGNVGGVDASAKENGDAADQGGSSVEVSGEMLEAMGLSEEQWAAMDPAKQEMILAEMSAVLENNKKEEQTQAQTQAAKKKYTTDDVMSGGKYKVVLGDYMNSITLYYENGKLVKIEEEFQKNDEEAAEYATYEGDDLAEYGFNFIDWDGASLQEILDGMKDYGGFGEYRISKTQ